MSSSELYRWMIVAGLVLAATLAAFLVFGFILDTCSFASAVCLSILASLPGTTRKRLEQYSTPILLTFILIFMALGAFLVCNSTAMPATRWMNIYDFDDFKTVRNVVDYLANLRVPIPPLISIAEIADHMLFGSSDLVTKLLYRESLVCMYVAAMLLAFPSPSRLIISFLASIVFLWGTVVVHPGNPMIYDVLFPFFALGAILLLKLVRSRSFMTPGRQIALCLMAGLLLSFAELSRPFFLIILPVILVGMYLFLRKTDRRLFIALAIPLLLFSGTWHMNMLLRHHQLLWTNQSGVNLYRAWPRTELPALITEVNDQPIKPNRWRNSNTQERYENSRLLQRAVARHIISHPWSSVCYAGKRISAVVNPKTSIYEHDPANPILAVYRPVGLLLSAFLLLNVVLVLLYALLAGKRCLEIIALPNNMIIITGGLSLLILALGEIHEEARLLISVLPFIATCAIASRLDTDDAP
jgi:hypothetical protein